MLHCLVFIEKLQTGFAVKFLHKMSEFVSSTENLVEFVVAEANHTVVFDGATIINMVDVGPHTGAKAHVARLASGVQSAARQVESAQTPAA